MKLVKASYGRGEFLLGFITIKISIRFNFRFQWLVENISKEYVSCLNMLVYYFLGHINHHLVFVLIDGNDWTS